jgi:hypothetical protein
MMGAGERSESGVAEAGVEFRVLLNLKGVFSWVEFRVLLNLKGVFSW